jgi:tripartite-type tricarboxylate transporter receptor subunit TctC
MRAATSLLTAILCLVVTAPTAIAETWPVRPLKATVPIGAGSVLDLVPRIVFEQLSTQLGQSIVVENRPGAGQTIGAGVVARAEPDGYALLVNSSAHTIAPALHLNLGYDPKKDFAAVALLGVTPFVLVVSASRGFRTVDELVAAAKAKPDGLTFASPGVGSGSHLSAEKFRASAGFGAVHVPFKGGVEALTEVMAGRVDFYFVALGGGLSQIREAKVVALVQNGSERSAELPDVPTTREAGFLDAENPTWFGLFLPAKTPRYIVEKLHRETLEALRNPKVKTKLATMGVDDPIAMTPADLDAYVLRQIETDAGIVKAAGLMAQ